MSRATENGVGAASPATDARERLFAAAVEAFADKGFHGTTTRDIATRAGMSPAALYIHHKSKEDLLYLISRAGHHATLRLVKNALSASENPVDQLTAVISAFTEHHARNHTTARIVNYELAALSPEHLNEIAGIRREIERHVREIVSAGVTTGDFHTGDPRMTTLALLSLGLDVARWYRDEGQWSPQAIAGHYRDLALRMLGYRDQRNPADA
ncbi:TetR/AcrR family transcriptional regulator [Hoyosella altamirensis]|uniref:AcrR family transcriptional regulator n=1 Tax=Hoyosella altamirensis TaxID=616997 RepID=A0A839RJ99_9ACTN|nr:TetR/AcrR family transcriptional regulator [Hoyosella altamirensis]MBB3036477.1 AcrR family transcriptional regulator [Hoyosella altamirensis]